MSNLHFFYCLKTVQPLFELHLAYVGDAVNIGTTSQDVWHADYMQNVMLVQLALSLDTVDFPR